MSQHQITNLWDLSIIGLIWFIGLAYKSIVVVFIWVVGLFNFNLSFSLVDFNEYIHTIVLLLGGILTVCKLAPMALEYMKGKKKTLKKTNNHGRKNRPNK